MSAAQSTVLNEDVRAAVLDAEAGDDEAAHCLVCYSELTHIALTPCNHNEICATCHLRIRFLEKDMKCPICKAGNEQLIVDSRIDRKPLFRITRSGGTTLALIFSTAETWECSSRLPTMKQKLNLYLDTIAPFQSASTKD